MLMDSVNDKDTDQHTDRVETETVEEVKYESTTQELQNNIGMQSVSRIHPIHTQTVHIMHAPQMCTQPCILMHTEITLPPSSCNLSALFILSIESSPHHCPAQPR